MATTNQSCTLFMKAGIESTPATMPLHTHGEASTGTPYAVMPLFVAEGAESTGTNDNITLFIKQTDEPPGAIILYVRGTATGGMVKSNSIPVFLQQGISPSGSMTLYVKGLGVTTHDQSDLVDSSGFNFHSTSIPLMIEREYEATTSTTKLFIEGQQTRTLTGTMPLSILTPSGAPSASLDLFLNSITPNNKINLYTRGY